jgi:arylsulfatase A-like enzyme
MYGNISYLPEMRSRMGSSFATLPEHLKSHGYHTQAVGNIMHVNDREGRGDVIMEKRYDEASWSEPRWEPERIPVPPWAPDHWTVSDALSLYALDNSWLTMRRRMQVLRSREMDILRNKKRWLAPATERADVPDDVYPDGKLTEQTVRFLDGYKKDKQKPFFLAVHYSGTHSPWCAPKKYWDYYEPESIVLPKTSAFPKGSPEFAPNPQAAPGKYYTQDLYDRLWRPSPEQLLELRHGYFACISYLDSQVGALTGALTRLGLAEDTIVVFTTDHGLSVGEHGHWHKQTNFEPDVGVPLIMRLPGHPGAGRRIDTPTEHVDLYPTLCDLCGLPTPGFLEGESLGKLIDDPDRRWEWGASSQMSRKHPATGAGLMGYSLRTERYRLTRWHNLDEDGKIEAVELYDYEEDPLETVNVAADARYVEVVEVLTAQMESGSKSGPPV